MSAWRECASDAEFADLFTGRTIERVMTGSEQPYDITWRFTDGLELGMELRQTGCDTCGFDTEKRFYVRRA